MKYSKFPWVSAIIMAGSVEAAANDRSAQTEKEFAKPLQRNFMPLPAKPAPNKYKAQYSDAETLLLPSLRSMRIVRQPLPGQGRVIITTSPRDVIAVPDNSDARMKVIVPPNQTSLRPSMPYRSQN